MSMTKDEIIKTLLKLYFDYIDDLFPKKDFADVEGFKYFSIWRLMEYGIPDEVLIEYGNSKELIEEAKREY